MNTNSYLYMFTRAISSGLTMAKSVLRGLLSNLYLINTKPSQPDAPLVYDGDYPHLMPQATLEHLDLLGYMFDVPRHGDEEDPEYRRRILFSIGHTPTINGISNAISRLLQTYDVPHRITIRENYRHVFDGTTSSFDTPFRTSSGSLLYGISVIIEPVPFDATTVVVDSAGQALYRKIDMFNFDTYTMEEKVYPSGATWMKVRSPYLARLIRAFKATSFRAILDDMIAAGVKLDRVVVLEPGAGGATVYGN